MTIRRVELRPTSTISSSTDLQSRLAHLVLERQQLRDRQASEFMLEQNRLEIVHTQIQLSEALVLEHSRSRVA